MKIRDNERIFMKYKYEFEAHDDDYMYFPYLANDAMYKCMELDKKYSLDELGL